MNEIRTLQAAVTDAADALETLAGHLERYAAPAGRTETHLLEAHRDLPQALWAGLDDLGMVHLAAHQDGIDTLTGVLAKGMEALSDAQEAECAICVPGHCPGPDCPGWLGAAAEVS